MLTNIASERRLGLIYDMQTKAAAGYARWKLDNDADALAIIPAWRLGPSTAKVPRGDGVWMSRWIEAGTAVGWEGAARNEMVALKTSPIWSALSRFGTPWPPFDFGSTRELEDVWRDEAEALGLVEPGDVLDAVAEQQFNEDMEASVTGLRPDQISTLELAFGDQVEMAGDRVAWRSPGQPYKSFTDFGLGSAREWKDSGIYPDRISSTEGKRRMQDGVSVPGYAGRKVTFNQETLDHWHGYDDEDARPSFLNVAIRTVTHPREVWKQDKQDVYVQGFKKPIGGKYKGCVVVVRSDGVAKTYFVENMKKLDYARTGIGYRE